MRTNPTDLWTSGMQDYFQHIKALRKEHGVVSPGKPKMSSSSHNSSSNSALLSSSFAGTSSTKDKNSSSSQAKSVSFAPSVGIKVGAGAATGFSFGGSSANEGGGGGSDFNFGGSAGDSSSSSSAAAKTTTTSSSSSSSSGAVATPQAQGSASSGTKFVVKRLRRYRKESTGENGKKLEAQWVELGLNANARLVAAEGKAKAVIEVRDSTREDKKYLINCSPHDGILKGIAKAGKKSIKMQLLEMMDVYDGATSTKTPTLNLYIFSFDGPGKRDAFEAELRRICS